MIASVHELTPADVDLLAVIASELPLRLDEVQQYWGSFVILGGRTPAGSPAHLRVVMYDWELVRDDVLLATSDGSVQENRSALDQLIGTRLMSFEVSSKRRRARIDFDSGHVLTMFVNLEAYMADDLLILSSWPAGMIRFTYAGGMELERHSDGQVG